MGKFGDNWDNRHSAPSHNNRNGWRAGVDLNRFSRAYPKWLYSFSCQVTQAGTLDILIRRNKEKFGDGPGVSVDFVTHFTTKAGLAAGVRELWGSMHPGLIPPLPSFPYGIESTKCVIMDSPLANYPAFCEPEEDVYTITLGNRFAETKDNKNFAVDWREYLYVNDLMVYSPFLRLLESSGKLPADEQYYLARFVTKQPPLSSFGPSDQDVAFGCSFVLNKSKKHVPEVPNTGLRIGLATSSVASIANPFGQPTLALGQYLPPLEDVTLAYLVNAKKKQTTLLPGPVANGNFDIREQLGNDLLLAVRINSPTKLVYKLGGKSYGDTQLVPNSHSFGQVAFQDVIVDIDYLET